MRLMLSTKYIGKTMYTVCPCWVGIVGSVSFSDISISFLVDEQIYPTKTNTHFTFSKCFSFGLLLYVV